MDDNVITYNYNGYIPYDIIKEKYTQRGGKFSGHSSEAYRKIKMIEYYESGQIKRIEFWNGNSISFLDNE